MPEIHVHAQTNADSYWIKVDKQDVHLAGPSGNHTGVVMLPAGAHTLFWGVFGDPGETIKIEVTQAGAQLLNPPVTGEIPAGFHVDGGFADFTVA